MKGLKGKTAIITGGGSGIGRALCLELAQSGAFVVVADIDEHGAAETVKQAVRSGGAAEIAVLDVTNEDEVKQLVRRTAAEHGALDFMFNNAGISMGGEVRDMTSDHFKRIMDINLSGVIHGTLAAYEIMIRQGSGRIINTASYYGLVPLPLSTPYNTTKFAVVGLSQSLRAEAAGLGVKVSVVCPGYIKTDFIKDGELVKSTGEDALSQVPFGLYDVTKAAKTILRGVLRNQGVIVFPFHAKLMWWITRASPSMLPFASRVLVQRFRKKCRQA